MSYYHCGSVGYSYNDRYWTGHEVCNGFIGPLDTYACTCECHDGDPR